MKRLIKIVFLCFLPLLWCCQKIESDQEKSEEVRAIDNSNVLADQNFEVNADALEKDYMAWYTYHYRNIHLAQEFTGLDLDLTILTKQAFLTKLATGNYIALKTKMKDGIPIYNLYNPRKVDASRQRTIRGLVSYELKNLNREGKEIPNFRFTDLAGVTYDNASSQGKILVLKCWFIGCAACVKEFPELNKLVVSYQQNPDVRFVSLASDTKSQLEAFLEKKPFRYAVVPGQDDFMQNKLGIEMYPTHILVNRQGRIVKVVNNVDDLIPALEKEIDLP